MGAALLLVPAAAADDWLPHPKHASWTYSWKDSEFDATPTKEKVTVKEQAGDTFTLAWTTTGLGNPATAVTSNGTVSFQDTNLGIVNTNWTSDPPPQNFPILCAQAASCGNSLASVWFNVIWGTRQPTILEPVLQDASWSSTGGYQNDVGSSSDYLRTEMVSVPAFSHPVAAAVIRSDVTQAGAIGDPYGSGVRTVWWVYGVGPVKMTFQHEGGAGAPLTTAELVSTNLPAKAPPSDANYFPLIAGANGKFRWTNARYFKQPVVQSFKVDQAANDSAQISIATVSGPLKAKGAYYFTLRTDGLSNLAGTAKAASLAKLPPLGPGGVPAARRRHFFTVFDLMVFGFNPVLPEYPEAGASWSSRAGTRDFDVYGVVGSSRVVGIQKVTVPAGTFSALVVRSTLKQAGTHTLTATQTTPGSPPPPGKLTSAASGAVTVPVYAPPPAPTISSPPASTISSLTLTGTGRAGATIKLYEGTTLIGTATVGTGGTWTLNVSLLLGPHTLAATQTDAVSGFTSTLSATVTTTVYLPTPPPTIVSISTPAPTKTPRR